jgi:hypothetical protein
MNYGLKSHAPTYFGGKPALFVTDLNVASMSGRTWVRPSRYQEQLAPQPRARSWACRPWPCTRLPPASYTVSYTTLELEAGAYQYMYADGAVLERARRG